MPKGNCEFTGSGRQYLEVFIVHIFLLGMLTLGIYGPWAWVRLLRLRASHTRINGKPMSFTGTGRDFLVLALINGLLTIVTLGVYWPWAACRISEWKARNTLVDGKPSEFVGTGAGLFVFSLIHLFILPALTLGLYYFYGMYRYYAWKQEHCRYGGATTSFGAGFWGVLRIFLIIVGILVVLPAIGGAINVPSLEWASSLICVLVSPWLIAMYFKWETEGLAVGDEEGIEHFPPAKTPVLWVILFVVVVLFAAAGAALYVKDQIKKTVSEVGGLGLFLGEEDLKKSPPVRGIVTQPPAKTPAVKGKTPLSGKPGPAAGQAAQPARQPSAQKKPREKSIIPVWTSPADKESVPPGTYERQIRDLNVFIEKYKLNAEAYYTRGCLHARLGNLETAYEDFTQAVAINHRSSDAFYNRGMVLARMGKYELAVKDFDEAIELDPHAADAYCNRGSAYFQLGKKDLAMKDYNSAIQMKPNDPDLYYNRGLIHLAEGRKEAAKADFRKAVELRDRPPAEEAEEEGGVHTSAVKR